MFINEWNKVATSRDNNKSRTRIFCLVNMKHRPYHFLIHDNFNPLTPSGTKRYQRTFWPAALRPYVFSPDRFCHWIIGSFPDMLLGENNVLIRRTSCEVQKSEECFGAPQSLTDVGRRKRLCLLGCEYFSSQSVFTLKMKNWQLQLSRKSDVSS